MVTINPADIDCIRVYYRLCKLLTSPVLEVKELAADFLFVLCKESGKYWVNSKYLYTIYSYSDTK